MTRIRVLPEILANKIAAGEIVERPASVVKELLENSIDAGATRITLEVFGAGDEMIKITDNGCGMVKEDALLAFERHATSKISSKEDLLQNGYACNWQHASFAPLLGTGVLSVQDLRIFSNPHRTLWLVNAICLLPDRV